MSLSRSIAVMSFNRPHYLKKVVESLKQSILFHDQIFDIYLFQDGNYNIYSHLNKCTDDLGSECVAVFKEAFPDGHVMHSPINLGVALNFFRAEEYLFSLKNYSSAMIFEDDLVLHPYYISVLDKMLEQAESDERIGQVACYGNDHLLDVTAQIESRNVLTHLGNNWGIGTSRRFYAKRRLLDRQYIDIISGIDYSQKGQFKTKIHELHKAMGFSPNVVSQDMFKTMTTYSAGGIRLNTRAVLGFYIGKQGLHSTDADYAAGRFGDTIMYPQDAPMPEPDMSILDEYRSEIDKQISLVGQMAPRPT